MSSDQQPPKKNDQDSGGLNARTKSLKSNSNSGSDNGEASGSGNLKTPAQDGHDLSHRKNKITDTASIKEGTSTSTADESQPPADSPSATSKLARRPEETIAPRNQATKKGNNEVDDNKTEKQTHSLEGSTKDDTTLGSDTEATSTTSHDDSRAHRKPEASGPVLSFRKSRARGLVPPLQRARQSLKATERKNKRQIEQLAEQLSFQMSQLRKAWSQSVDKIIEDRIATSNQKQLYAHLHLQAEATHHAQLSQAFAAVEALGNEVNAVKVQLNKRKGMRAGKITDEMIVGKWEELRNHIHDLAQYLTRFKLRLWPEHVHWRLRLIATKIARTQEDTFDETIKQYLKAYFWHVVFTAVFHTTSGAWKSEPRATLSELKTKLINATTIQREHMADLEQWLLDGAELLEHASNDPDESRVLGRLVESETYGICNYLLDADIRDEEHGQITESLRGVFSTALQLHQMMLFSRPFFHISMGHGARKFDEAKMEAVDGFGDKMAKARVKLVISPLVMKETAATEQVKGECQVLIKSDVVCQWTDANTSGEDLTDSTSSTKQGTGDRKKKSREDEREQKKKQEQIRE